MNYAGDAAEQVVKMSLEGVEVSARIFGAAAKEVAVMLVAALKNKGSTMKLRGKERLNAMLKSGKALEIFSVKESDLSKFAQGAKQYGIVYCVLRQAKNSPDGMCDVMVKADDAPKISRIIERFKFGTVDKAKIESEIIRDMNGKTVGPQTADAPAVSESGTKPDDPELGEAEKLVNELIGSDEGKTVPATPESEKSVPDTKEAQGGSPLAIDGPARNPSQSERISEPKERSIKDTADKQAPDSPPLPTDMPEKTYTQPEPASSRRYRADSGAVDKPSIKEEMREIKAERTEKDKNARRQKEMAAPEKPKESIVTTHQQPPRGGKNKSKQSKGSR